MREQDRLSLVVELINACNLRCGYCVRDDAALHEDPQEFLSPDLLARVLREAQEVTSSRQVVFTGGEPTLHPCFAEIVGIVADAKYRMGLITNGWHFGRIALPALLEHRDSLLAVAFSIDGPDAESHDRWRGRGSFVRVVRAMAQAHFHGLPFKLKIVVRRDTLPHLERMTLLAARLGASGVVFAHLLPTSPAIQELGLSHDDWKRAEQEIGILATIFKMPVDLSAGHWDVSPRPPCQPLAAKECNIDYLGRLTLCCNLSGFRGAAKQDDVLADLNHEDFRTGFDRLRRLAGQQVERRRAALEHARSQAVEPDLGVASPCLFCLQSLGKIPWRTSRPPVAMESPARVEGAVRG